MTTPPEETRDYLFTTKKSDGRADGMADPRDSYYIPRDSACSTPPVAPVTLIVCRSFLSGSASPAFTLDPPTRMEGTSLPVP